MAAENNQQPNQLNIEISEEVSEGQYANLAIITHSHAEFVFDFVNVMPGTPKSKVKSRLIMTPFHAKRFMKAIVENVQKFEASHGEIKDMEKILRNAAMFFVLCISFVLVINTYLSV